MNITVFFKKGKVIIMTHVFYNIILSSGRKITFSAKSSDLISDEDAQRHNYYGVMLRVIRIDKTRGYYAAGARGLTSTKII